MVQTLLTPYSCTAVLRSKVEFTRDLTQQVPTTGIPMMGANPARKWAAFVNQGPDRVDLIVIGRDGSAVEGRISMFAGQAVVFDCKGRTMEYYGSISAAAATATTTVSGIEVYEA